MDYEALEIGKVVRSRFGRTVLEADNVWFTLRDEVVIDFERTIMVPLADAARD
jgi:acyl dehydratase